MEIYLVGGAVRDELMGRAVKERDWVVVGATPEEMLALGYRQVGKDFPVFLHPKTHEEYALARTERKVALGYTGFLFDTSPTVTLEEDLRRRDLTINAIARNAMGEWIDPTGGRADIRNKILRHVSDAFVEDPVRILRLGRFAARFAEYGFRIAPETNALMQKMVQAGEVDALVPERVWKEWERALGENHPEVFFQVLSACGALPLLFPMVDLAGEGMQALQRAVSVTRETDIRLAVLLHDLQETDIAAMADRYRLPRDPRELALLVARYVDQYDPVDRENDIGGLFRALDAFRRPERAQKFALACRIITQNENAGDLFDACLLAARSVDNRKIVETFKGSEIAEQLDHARSAAIEKVRKSWRDKSI